MVPDAGEVVENQVYSDGIPEYTVAITVLAE
jgi:hypothetical protein